MSGRRTLPRAAKLCPFCGGRAEMERWHGGGPDKRFIQCSNEECPVTPQAVGETKYLALKAWNTRTP